MPPAKFERIHLVVQAYVKCVQDFYTKFFKLAYPFSEKVQENCLKVYDLTEKLSVDLPTYMFAAIDWYDPAWCEETFKKKYPPFNLTISDKARKRVELVLQKPLKAKSVVEAAKPYLKMLQKFDKETSIFAVRQGVCGHDRNIKKYLLGEIAK